MSIALTPVHVGKRLLIQERTETGYFEVTLLEISPSGTRVNFLFESGHSQWCDVDQYVVEEILPDPVKKKRRKARKKKAKKRNTRQRKKKRKKKQAR